MQLEFTILWVEDQPEEVVGFPDTLRRRLRDLGFTLKFINARNVGELRQKVDEDVEDDDVDLILVDFDLGVNGENGGDAAVEIRERFKHREIVFYSGKSPGALRKVAFEKNIDGVYFGHRPTLAVDVVSVIENILRKVVDISHMRGIVMAETSEIDYLMELGLSEAYGRLDDDGRRKFHAKAVDVIKERYDQQLDELTAHADPANFQALLTKSLLMSSRDKSRALIRFLRVAQDLADSDQHKEAVANYQDKFQDTRNQLAHGLVVKKDGKKVFSGREEVLDEDAMRKWRFELVEHKENIRVLATALGVAETGI